MYTPLERLWVVPAVVALLSGCQQVDQVLPFQLDEEEGVTVPVSTNGQVVSLPPSFSMRFPAGSYSGSVSVARRISAPFPSDAGVAVPGTAFDVGPVGTTLGAPATVQLAVPVELLAAGDEVRLGVALLRSDQSVATFTATYDVTNGILSAQVDELGPVAAVLLADAIPVSLETPPTLPGGSFSPPAPAPPGPALTSHGGVLFEALCGPLIQRCFASGRISVYADEVTQRRLGNVMFLVDATVDAELDFRNFDPFGVPQTVIGEIRIGGELRARLNRVVTHDEVDEVESTGLGETVVETQLTLQGNRMIFAETTDDFDVEFEYGVTGIGTGELLTVRIDGELEFDNGNLPDEIGQVVVHVRLRR